MSGHFASLVEDRGHVPGDPVEAVEGVALGDDDRRVGVVAELVDPDVGVEWCLRWMRRHSQCRMKTVR